MTIEIALTWTVVCPLARLQPERGVAALLGDVQVALFRTHDDAVYAVGNVDPFSGAAVLSRGIVGDRGGVPTVASPVYKQAFDLRTGRCLDAPGVTSATSRPGPDGADQAGTYSIPTYPVRVTPQGVEVGLP